jgi:ATP-binding cassette subfamily B protein
MRPHRTLWITAITLSILFFIGLDVILPWMISRFIGELQNLDGKTFSDYSWFLWAWVVVRIFVFILGRIQIRLDFKALTRTMRDIDLKSFDATLSHSSDFFANNFAGSVVTKFNRFSRSFDVIAAAVMYDLSALFVQLVFPITILYFITPVIATILLVWSICYGAMIIVLHRRKIPLSRDVAEYDSRVTGHVADAITNTLSIKMFAMQRLEQASFKDLSEERVLIRMKNLIFGDYIRVYKTIFIIVLQTAVFYFSIKFALDGTLNVAEVLLIQFYIQQLAVSLWNFGKLVEKLEEALADATEMTEIYELEPSVKDISNPDTLEHVQGTIRLDNVGFTYDGDNERPVFTKLDLTIPKGQKIGFVGPSGGGKTTLTKLLLRFMDVSEGRVLIDNQDISKITQDNLRENIAYVPQEPLLFHRSIYDNILYGNPKASKEEVLEAARLAHADEFIKKLSHGYETLVGERGVKLSGGQKQRVAIARAMLKKAPILVLDEATSALDSKSEKLIVNALDTLMQSRTTIVIAHRLSTIKKLDRIIVLTEDGAIEDGTHTELLKKKGIYAELWSHQHDDFLGDK